jgi:hypothetical protein
MLEDGTWNYPSSKETLETAGLLTINDYIEKRKTTVSAYVKTTTIFNECKERTPSTQNSNQIVWWKNMTCLQNEGNESDENE